MSSSEQMAENMLTAMQIIAESQPNNNDITIDGFIIDASRAKEGVYTVGSGYSQFTAYAFTTYKENDDVYILIPGGDYNKTKFIIGRRMTESSGAYNVIDELENMVFFHDSNSSLINFSGKSLGIQANNSLTQEILIGTWEGSYAGVSRLGLAPTFTSYLKPLGIINGSYGIRLLITDNTGTVEKVEFDSSEYFGNPYNYIYSTRLTRVYELTTTKTIIKIEAYLYQKNNFADFNEDWVAPTNTNKNIFLTKFFVGVGATKSEIMASRCMIATTSGSNTYYSPEYAETLDSNPAIERRFNKAIDGLLSAACEDNSDETTIENAWQSMSSNFSLAELTRINNWLKNYKFFSQLTEAKSDPDRAASFCQQAKQDAAAELLSQLTCYTPRISFSFAVTEDDKTKYYSSIPSFDATSEGKKAKSEFIQWFRAKAGNVINSNTLPPELLTGWELIGYMDIDGKTTDNFLSTGELVFIPDYTQNTETLKALITYKNKQYISNALVLNNLRNAEKEISQEEIKKALDEVTAQRYSDLDLISANQKALNDIYLDCGYYDGEDFISNHGQFNYYTRSGLIREEWEQKKFVIRCYSLNSERTTLPAMLASNKDFYCAQAGSRTSMIFSQQDAIYKSFNVNGTAVNGYELAFTPSRYYEAARTANTFTFSAKCHVDGNTSDILLENSLTLSFGYYDCLGTSHTVIAYWTSKATNEKVYSLVPGKEYIPHIVIDGKEMPGNWELKGSGLRTGSFTTYTPDLQDICVAYGVVEVGKVTQEDPDGLKLACYLPAIISYNEDNIIEGPTEIVYLSDGLPHLRMSELAEDVGPTYRLELLIEDNDNNQKYMTDVPWIDTITPQTTDKLTLAYGITADWLTGSENVTVSSPSNWSIQAANNKDPIAYMRGSKAQTLDVEIDDVKAQVSLRNFGTLTACSVKYTDDTHSEKVTDYSKVELTPLSYFLSEMDGQVYGVRVYTAYGYLLATIPVICRISHYASAYIDNMAQYNGTVKIDEDNAIIYSPRILAGKYEDIDAGQKIFTGVALGDYCDTNTDPSMRLTGIYGFNKGTQVYAFKEDGTAFIGSNKGRINFDGTNATLYNSGYYSSRGMLINLNDSNIFCKNGNYQAYFGAGNNVYPLWISNTNNFSVDWDGNVTIGGKGSINISNGATSAFKVNRDGINMTGMISLSDEENNKVNIDGKGISLSSGGLASVIINSNGIQLTGNITGIDYNNLSNKPSIPDADSLKMSDEQIAEAVSRKSPGLYYENGKLGINANGISTGYLNANLIHLNGTFTSYEKVSDENYVQRGMLGYAHGTYSDGDNTKKDSYGVGMCSANLQLTNIDSPIKKSHGGYVLLTDYGARLGYVNWGEYDTTYIHHCIVCSKGGISLIYEDSFSNVKHTATLNATGWHFPPAEN